MEFLHRTRTGSGSIALLPAAWNPPTRAHVAMLRAAQVWAAEVVLVLPRALPRSGQRSLGRHQRRRAFHRNARECRAAVGVEEVYLVCGSDAAERIVGWDYRGGDPIGVQLDEYQLLVAPRGGVYLPSPGLAGRIHSLRLGDGWHEVSSSEVRRRLQTGTVWAELVPEEIAGDVRAAYPARA